MKNKKYYLLAFIIPIFIMVILYLCAGIICGNKNILTVDLAGQYIAFFNALKNMLSGKIGWFYSFSKTLGGNLFGLAAYYLISPLNVLVLFFNRIDMPTAILIINILKIGFAGLTSYIYFNNTFKNTNRLSLTFSIIYALMAYNIVYSQNIMWLDGVILLPIIFYGIDKLRSKRPLLFFISLTLSIIFNYYIGYMSCIASLIYFIYKDYLDEKKLVFKNIISFIKYILLSVLASCIVLLPALAALLNGKASGFLGEFVPNQRFAIFDIITRFYIGTFKNSDLLGVYPQLYISLFAITLVIYYFFNNKVSKYEKKAAIILISVFLISIIFYPINAIWHTLKQPVGFPFRYSFIFDFVLLIIAYNSILKLGKIDKKYIKKFTLYALLLTLFVDKELYTGSMYYKAVGTFVLLIIYLLYLSKKKHNQINIFIVLLIIIEMFINDLVIVLNIKYQPKKEYTEFATNYGYIIDSINDKESFYRLEKDYSYSTNDELLLNYNGISHFSSVYEAKTNELLNKLGIFNRFYITNSNGSTLVTNSLFNIKYFLSEEEKPYYDKQGKYKDINIYINKYNLPIGFTVEEKIKNLELKKYDAFKNQNDILKAMDENIEDVFKKEEYQFKTYNLILEKEKKGIAYKKINSSDKATITIEIEPKTEGILYAYLPQKKYKRIDIKRNDQSIIDINDENNYHANIIELEKENEKITLEVELLENEIEFEDIMFYTLDLQKFEQAINILKNKNPLVIKNYKNDYIEAEIKIEENNEIVYTSIPYDKGMTITVDGKKVKPEVILDSLLGLKLEKGNHSITISYIPRGLKSGAILSIIGIMLFIFTKKSDELK